MVNCDVVSLGTIGRHHLFLRGKLACEDKARMFRGASSLTWIQTTFLTCLPRAPPLLSDSLLTIPDRPWAPTSHKVKIEVFIMVYVAPHGLTLFASLPTSPIVITFLHSNPTVPPKFWVGLGAEGSSFPGNSSYRYFKTNACYSPKPCSNLTFLWRLGWSNMLA